MAYQKMPGNKVIITAALSGAMVTKKMTPAVPETPEEMAQAAYECYNAGAAIVHFHARGPDGKITGSAAVFQKIHDLTRAKCPIILQDSTGGGSNLTIEQRTECLEAHPEMASLNMGTLVRVSGEAAWTVWMNTRPDIEAFVTRMNKFGVKPEMECYNVAMLYEAKLLIEKGLLKKPYYCDCILGMSYQGALWGDPTLLPMYINNLPDDTMFNCLGVGPAQTSTGALGMIYGGNARVGLEDNIYYKKGELAKSNAQLVERIVRVARDIGKEPCTPDEARQIFGLPPLKK